MKEYFTPTKACIRCRQFAGLSTQVSRLECIAIMLFVGMFARGSLLELLLTVMSQSHRQYSNTTAGTGMDVWHVFRMTDRKLCTMEKQEMVPSLHKSSPRSWLPCHWEIGVRWSKNTRRSAKTGSNNSSSSNLLWFRIVPSQNAEKRSHGRAYVWKRTCVPISLSIGNTLKREHTHICEPN